MATLTHDAQELDEADLDELGIEAPSNFVSAFQPDADTINLVVHDPDGGSHLDDPSQDHSGEDAWEWIAFDNGRERDDWHAAHGGEPNLVWIERYEHGLVNYAPLGEASVIDRQWDVASGVAVIRFKHDSWPGVANLVEVAREICREYTSWCNGDVYGIITFHRRSALDAPNCPVLVPDEFATEQWVEGDSCWGFVGHEYAERTAKNNDL
jgi:hypothetical protein